MIRVFKVADVIEKRVIPTKRGDLMISEFSARLTNLPAAPDPISADGWSFDLVIGSGPGSRTARIDLPQFLNKHDLIDQPIFLNNNERGLLYFYDMLFLCERIPLNQVEVDEVILRVKKQVYEERSELFSLKSAVANFEAALEYQRNGPKRDPIPENVKAVIWARDGGACVRCGAQSNLHFDHIIPVSKGGGSSAENIQILCGPCNLRKSDKIASS